MKVTNEQNSIQYGSFFLEGDIVRDNISYSDKAVVHDMSFITVDYMPGNPMSGIIGLSPKDDSAGPLFIDELF